MQRALGRLRRKRAVPVERLRDETFGRYLIRRWEEAVADFDARAAPPDLRNTNGDRLLFTTDHYGINPGAAPAVAERLAAMEDVRSPEEGEDSPSYVFLRPASPGPAGGETTVIGQARLSGTTLELETNSRQRADALRARVEAACGEELRHRAREHTDPLSPKVVAAAGHPAPEPPTPEMEQLVLEFKRRH